MKWGMNPYVFMVVILALMPTAHAQGGVTILTSDNPADQAAASAWAAKVGATLVVTPWGGFSESALNEVVFSQATIVYVVGGDVAVPGAEDRLSGYDKTVIRVGGIDRVETSLSVAERFGASRAVILDAYDVPAMEEATTLAKAEGIPVLFLRPDDADVGTSLRRLGLDDVTLLSSPAVSDDVRASIMAAGMKLTDPSRDRRSSAKKMVDLADSELNKTVTLVRTIKDGPSLTAAQLIVEAKIDLGLAQEALGAGRNADSYSEAVKAYELLVYAYSIYNGRYPGFVADRVAQANSDILKDGLDTAKNRLKDLGAPYGVGIPVPPIVDIEFYMVDIPGYTKSAVAPGIEYDMGAKYTKKVGQSINVEIYKRADEADAIKWVEQTQFSPGVESRNWVDHTISGYPYTARLKKITYTASDNMNQEIYIRVAVGNLGVFSKFTQSVRKSDAPSLLLHPDIAQQMVEEVTIEIIKAIESSQ